MLKVASFGKLLLSFLVLLSFSLSFYADRTEAAYSFQAKVNADVLNVRSQPGTAYSIVGKLKQGQVVTVYEQKNGWSRISYGSLKGWVASQYITATTWTGYVTATNLNFRSAPGGSILGSLPKGTAVKVYGADGSWLKVYASTLNKTGWVSSSYITKQKPATTVTKVVLKVNTNIRKGPSTSYPILYTEKAGTFMEKLGVSNGWVKVKSPGGVVGWVYGPLVRDPNTVLKGKVIVLDPGHGGYDSGTMGKTYLEKTLTLRTALELKPLLENAGAKVILTRSSDTYLSLTQRVNISNNYKAHAFISLHYNAYSSTSSGVMTFYYSSSKDAPLAGSIQSSLAASTQLRNMGSKYGNYHVVRENKQPAALVELGFLSNPTEEKLVATTTYQKKAAKGIYNGLFRYFLTR
ncbi:N-acetylmuramoyl-L-alanine amidase [Mesobacillus selenatarsenatis]|uniref:N-acetylmuramoyl-L-alanine amidase n=1 Tax=Mesobacillus selenatarsenatis (strain DSM 18680 / JCM 14380 / FERM P-15431 / SF-1) TaxID=1321606 RepID=A0A0A8X9C8_MESS1|nr:N-acetylmuramoyl-L-alanine amidase [Mesobacillus selenatarsenatis]GAM14756.1 N-acetylmuramoyl-L-alanine amidase [Mesobacillus selenatarsenatis SF-1]